jgi:MFS family permease
VSRIAGARRHLGLTLLVVRAVLRNPALRRVQIAHLLFSSALYGCYVAVLIYAYDASGPGAVGIVALAQLLPAAVVAPFAASLADRFPRERVLLAGYAVQALAYGTTAAGMLLGLPPALVYLGAAVQSAGTTFTRPAQGSLLPSLSRTPEELTAANSVSGTIEGTGVLLGPVAATAMLAVAGPGGVWTLGAVVATIAALLVVGLPRLVAANRTGAIEPAAPDLAAIPDESVTALVGGGLRALAANADTRLVVGLLAVRMLISGAMDVLFVLLALEVFGTGQTGTGILNAGLGLGTVLGGAASIALVGRKRMAPALAASAAIWGVAIVVTATVAPAWLAPMLVAVGAVGFSATDVTGRTILQRVTPDRLLARVLGALEGIGLVCLAIGSVAVPVLVGLVGIPGTLAVVGLLLPASVAIGWLPLLSIDRRVQVPVRELGLLQLTAVFAPLPAPQLESAARRTRWVTAEPGRVIIREGDEGDRFYVLESGRLRVSIEGRHVRTLETAGASVGEIALLRDVPRTATVVAETACVLLALDRADFLEAVTGHEASRDAAELQAGRHIAGT